MSCSVLSCQNYRGRNRESRKGKSTTYHSFPRSRPEIYQQWVTNVRRGTWQPSVNNVVCSDHFEEDCFDRTGQTVRLRADAIPTKNLGRVIYLLALENAVNVSIAIDCTWLAFTSHQPPLLRAMLLCLYLPKHLMLVPSSQLLSWVLEMCICIEQWVSTIDDLRTPCR
ncbi:THAP domain-containing protein 1 B [Ixodes scapularis]|uniref:THAP domain-containing protein 1 B n=1 Tax=Ixodes scapularis TaxID=6945 RepID=UPI001A9E583C|nr:THAP domain-containing protein 1 B [Ixodes scapularis]